MRRDEELPIIRAFYDFVLWLNPKITKFPRDQRFVLRPIFYSAFSELSPAQGVVKTKICAGTTPPVPQCGGYT